MVHGVSDGAVVEIGLSAVGLDQGGHDVRVEGLLHRRYELLRCPWTSNCFSRVHRYYAYIILD